MIGGLVGLAQGLWPGKSIFNLAKGWLKVEDFGAGVVIMLLTAALSVVALWLLGYFEFGNVKLTLDMLFGLAYSAYSMSQAGYQWFKGTNKPDVMTDFSM